MLTGKIAARVPDECRTDVFLYFLQTVLLELFIEQYTYTMYIIHTYMNVYKFSRFISVQIYY